MVNMIARLILEPHRKPGPGPEPRPRTKTRTRPEPEPEPGNQTRARPKPDQTRARARARSRNKAPAPKPNTIGMIPGGAWGPWGRRHKSFICSARDLLCTTCYMSTEFQTFEDRRKAKTAASAKNRGRYLSLYMGLGSRIVLENVHAHHKMRRYHKSNYSFNWMIPIPGLVIIIFLRCFLQRCNARRKFLHLFLQVQNHLLQAVHRASEFLEFFT